MIIQWLKNLFSKGKNLLTEVEELKEEIVSGLPQQEEKPVTKKRKSSPSSTTVKKKRTTKKAE